jgi:hypothetical protein
MSYTNKKQKRQRTNYVYFQTQRGTSEIRHSMDIYNSALKRGEIKNADSIVREHFVICGCGAEGCGFVSVIRKDDKSVECLKEGKDPWRRR